MEDRVCDPAIRNCFYYFLSAALNYREWFWGVVLTLLLMIGCVESNPGPRSDKVSMRVKLEQNCTVVFI
jgi:hypothetical protein